MQEVHEKKICYFLEDSSSEFFHMQGEWDDLLHKSQQKNIFLTWEWLYSWWEVYKENRKLFILTAKKGKEIVGIWPLVKRKIDYYGMFSFWRVEFISTGENDFEESCPFWMGIICIDDEREEVYKGFVDYLTNELQSQWDELLLLPVLQDHPEGKTLVSHLKEKNDYCCKVEYLWDSLYTQLPDSWDDFLMSLGRKTRKKIRKGRRDLEAMQDYSYSFLDKEADFPSFFDQFVDMHKLRWDGGGAFANTNFLLFQKKVCRLFNQRGWLRLSLMSVGDSIVSGNLDYQYGRIVFGYQTAHDPSFMRNLSVGFVGMSYCLDDAISHNCQVYDWYRATSGNDYKLHFNALRKRVISIHCKKKNLQFMILIALQQGKLLCKKLVEWMSF